MTFEQKLHKLSSFYNTDSSFISRGITSKYAYFENSAGRMSRIRIQDIGLYCTIQRLHIRSAFSYKIGIKVPCGAVPLKLLVACSKIETARSKIETACVLQRAEECYLLSRRIRDKAKELEEMAKTLTACCMR